MAALAIALAGCGGSKAPAAEPPAVGAALNPIAVQVRSAQQEDLLGAGRVPVRLRAPAGAHAKVRVRLLRYGGGRFALGKTRIIVPTVGKLGPLTFRLPAAAREAIRACEPLTLDVRAVAKLAGERSRTKLSLPVRRQPPRCGRFFGSKAIWNQALAHDAALDANSRPMVDALLKQLRAAYSGGLLPTINTLQYSTPIYTVPRNKATVPVRLEAAGGELQQVFEEVPIPDRAVPAAGTDQHMVVWQPARDRMWELWRARRAKDGWHAGFGGRLDTVSSDPGYFSGDRAGWGATASSLPLVGGLMTGHELARGVIRHALSVGVPGPRAGVFAFPAQRTDGTSTEATALPEGARLRLDPDLDLRSLHLPPVVLAMARAAQRYGIVVRDVSGAVSFYAQAPGAGEPDPYPAIFGGSPAYDLLRTFPWQSLQVLKMDLKRQPTKPTCLPPLC